MMIRARRSRAAAKEIVPARVSPDVVAVLKRLAERENRSQSSIVDRLLRRHLEDIGELPKVHPERQ